jgi:hypothetical protein
MASSRERRTPGYTRDVVAPDELSVAQPTPQELSSWWREFEAAARRPLRQRFRYSFIRTYKPVLDDARFRAFDSMASYREWCERNLPSWLGYGRSL